MPASGLARANLGLIALRSTAYSASRVASSSERRTASVAAFEPRSPSADATCSDWSIKARPRRLASSLANVAVDHLEAELESRSVQPVGTPPDELELQPP